MAVAVAVEIDQPPVAFAAPPTSRRPVSFELLDDRDSVGHRELALAAGRQPTCHRVVFQKRFLPALVKTLRPGLELSPPGAPFAMPCSSQGMPGLGESHHGQRGHDAAKEDKSCS